MKSYYLYSIIIACLASFGNGLAQHNSIDSLLNKIKNEKNQINIINLKDELGWQYLMTGEYDKAKKSSKSAIALIHKLRKNKKNRTLKQYDKLESGAYNALGNIYFTEGNFPLALQVYFTALHLSEKDKKNNLQQIAATYTNLGTVYTAQKNFNLAHHYYKKGLSLQVKLKEKPGIAYAYNNLGLMHYEQNLYDTSLKYYKAALALNDSINNPYLSSAILNNMGLIYFHTKKNELAIDYHLKSLALKQKLDDKYGIASSYNNLGLVYNRLNDTKRSKMYLTNGLTIATSIGSLAEIRSAYEGLAIADSIENNYQSALINYKLAVAYNDSLVNDENTKKSVQTQMQYEFDKTQTADSIKNAEHAKQETLKHNQEIKQQKIYTYGGVVGFGLMLIVAFVSFRAFRNKQKANHIIAEQKQQVEEKQKEIIDSIHYAKRIQLALLPSSKYISSILNRQIKK